jgi:hypothetical protein
MKNKLLVLLLVFLGAFSLAGLAGAEEEKKEDSLMMDTEIMEEATPDATLFMIRDAYKKAAKHQHLADRTLFEALKVAEKGNIPLATHTAFKGEHHMTQLINEVKAAVYSGLELNSSIIDRAHKSAKRHQDLLRGMKSRAKGDAKQDFDTIIEFSQRNDSELAKVEIEATAEAELDFEKEEDKDSVE